MAYSSGTGVALYYGVIYKNGSNTIRRNGNGDKTFRRSDSRVESDNAAKRHKIHKN